MISESAVKDRSEKVHEGGRRVRTLAVVAAVASPAASGALAVAALSSATLIAPHLRAAHPAPHAPTDGHRVARGGELGRSGLVAGASIAAIEPAHEKIKVLVQATEEIFVQGCWVLGIVPGGAASVDAVACVAETVHQIEVRLAKERADRFCTHPTGHALPSPGRRAGCRCRALLAAA